MADLKFDYPQVLTKNAWDKNKGLIAKLVVGKTDVGAALTQLEDEWKKSGLGAVKPFPQSGDQPADAVAFLAYEKKVLEGLTKGVSNLKARTQPVDTITRAAHSEFEKSKTVPKSSTAYAKSIIDGVGPFKKNVEGFPEKVKKELRKDFQAAVQKSPAFPPLKKAAETGEQVFANLMAMIKKVEANPKVDFLHSTFASDGPHRQFTTWCKFWDQLIAKQFPKTAASVYTGQAMGTYFTLPGMADMGDEPGAKASTKLRALVTSGQEEGRVVKTFMLQYSSSVIKAKELVNHIKSVYAKLTAIK